MKRRIKINADNIAFLIREDKAGPTHVHFVGSNYATGKPDLLVLETLEAEHTDRGIRQRAHHQKGQQVGA